MRDGADAGDGKKIRKYTVLGGEKVSVGGFEDDGVHGGES